MFGETEVDFDRGIEGVKWLTENLTLQGTEEIIIKIIKRQTGSEINALTRLDSTNADSIDFVEIIMEIEEAWKIEIPDHIAATFMGKPPAEIAAYVKTEKEKWDRFLKNRS